MRPTSLLCLALATSLTGCAVEGVVVEKNSRPFPFVASLGVDGMYKFKLRNSQGHICSQMVTPDVFFQYEVGDHFNDLVPARRSRVELEEVRTVETVRRVSHYARKRSKLAQGHRTRKIGHAKHRKTIARANHAKKIRQAPPQVKKKIVRAHHAKKRTAKAQARRVRAAAKVRVRSA